MAHLHTSDAGGTLAGILLDDSLREVGTVGHLEYILVSHVGGNAGMSVAGARDGLAASQCSVAIDNHLHALSAAQCGPRPDIVVARERTCNL